MLEETGGNHKPDRALIFTNLALLYREAGRTAKSEALLRQAIAIDTKALPSAEIGRAHV